MDAYEDEMSDFSELSDPDGELAELLTGLKAAYLEAPSAQVASAHLAAIAAESSPLRLAADAELESASRTNRRTRRFRMIAKRTALLPAAVLVALLSTVGLAAAGVTMPGAARAPFDAVGVQLPNQSHSGTVHAVIDATAPADRGCAFGQSVASAASQGNSAAAGTPCEKSQAAGHSQAASHSQADEHGQGSDTSSDTTENTNAGGPPSGVPPTPPDGQSFGQATASNAQTSASSDGQAFGQSTAQGAQGLTPATPPSDAGSSAEPPASSGGEGQGGPPSDAGSAADSTPGGSHTP